MSDLLSFSWLSDTPARGSMTFALSVLLSTDVWVVLAFLAVVSDAAGNTGVLACFYMFVYAYIIQLFMNRWKTL